MSDTTFTSGTVISSPWLNDINDHVYTSTPVSPNTTVHPASSIANTPTGSVSSVTVQAAIDELASEKAALSGGNSLTGTQTITDTGSFKGRHQVGVSATAANNFTITAQADDGTMKLARGNNGATTQDLITVSSTNIITGASGATLVGNGPIFSYVPAIGQGGIVSGVLTKITVGTSEFDTTGGGFASSRFTASVPGYYQINASVGGDTTATTSYVFVTIYKNGVRYKDGPSNYGAASTLPTSQVNCIVSLAAGDYIEMYAAGSNNGSPWGISTLAFLTYFQAGLIRSI